MLEVVRKPTRRMKPRSQHNLNSKYSRDRILTVRFIMINHHAEVPFSNSGLRVLESRFGSVDYRSLTDCMSFFRRRRAKI